MIDDRKLLQQAIDALTIAHSGLLWYREMLPEYVDGSDDEADAEITQAITALESAIGVKAVAEGRSLDPNRKVCGSPCMEGKREQRDGRWVWTGPCSCYPSAGVVYGNGKHLTNGP